MSTPPSEYMDLTPMAFPSSLKVSSPSTTMPRLLPVQSGCSCASCGDSVRPSVPGVCRRQSFWDPEAPGLLERQGAHSHAGTSCSCPAACPLAPHRVQWLPPACSERRSGAGALCLPLHSCFSSAHPHPCTRPHHTGMKVNVQDICLFLAPGPALLPAAQVWTEVPQRTCGPYPHVTPAPGS